MAPQSSPHPATVAMPPKKATKLKEKLPADPVVDPTAIPPALPPSVEEAYRRKCVQLKQRTNEVEEENDATRIRLARIRRQIEKMRVERAFLLEQLTRRTSTNVEDSEGSPSPPPTPKDKPLRTKRGHRKPSMMADLEASMKSAASSFANPNLPTMSPSSEAFSHSQAGARGTTNGLSKPPKKPADAFELYREEARPALLKKRDEQEADAEAEPEEEANVDEELTQAWKDLPDAKREVFQNRHDDLVAEYEKDLAEYDAAKKDKAASPEKEAEETEDAEAPPKDDKGDKDEPEKAKDEGKSESESKDKDPAKEDEEMKDSDKVEEKEKAEPAAETQDEDVEMGDTDAPAASEEKKRSEEAE